MATGVWRRTGRAAAALALAGGATAAWSLLEARALFRVEHLHLPLLQPGSSHLRVLQIADLHLLPSQRRKIAWVRALARYKPDLVINTGDNLAHPGALPALLETLEPFLDTPGAFVFGSNDYHGPVWKNPLLYPLGIKPKKLAPPADLPHEQLARELTAAGWLDLRNKRALCEIRGTRLEFIGVDDPHIDLDDYPPEPANSASQKGLSPATKIGVVHAPYTRVLDLMSQEGADLIIAGHTHGGQVCIPGYGALVTNCDLPVHMASGLHRWPSYERLVGDVPDKTSYGAHPVDGEPTALYVSRGLGTSPYTPFRLACRPTATVLELTPRAV